MKDVRRPAKNAAAPHNSPSQASGRGGASPFQIELPAEVVEQIVGEVTERVRGELAASSPWMARQPAADYLDVPLSRLQKDRTVPCHRWEGRVFYDRRELDAWLAAK